MPVERPACSTISLGAEEPLYGTASRLRHWLLIEQPGRWGHRALVDSGLPAELGRHLEALGGDLGMRVLLIKQRERPSTAPRRCFVAYTGRREQRLRAFEVDDPRDIFDLDLPRIVGDRLRSVGEPFLGPLYLVCTHGKHDPCCARLGGPLFRALEGSAGDAAWEATHVGGDRFAGNLVCFPHGLYFGRVSPEEAAAVVQAYDRGQIDLRFYRGRSSHPPAVQAAEHFVRERTGLTAVEDLVLIGHESRPGNRHLVAWRSPRGMHRVELEVTRWEERPLTCKAMHPGRPRGFILHGIR